MPRTITANYLNGLLLTNPSDSPVSIAQGVVISSGTGVPLFVAAGDWSISNAGFIQGTATAASVGLGLYVQKAAAGLSRAVLTNQSTGQISGSQFGVVIYGTGTIDNQGAIFGAARDGARLAVGGTIINETGASIGGIQNGLFIYGGSGTVNNQSTITGATSNAVILAAGGSVSNNAASAAINGGVNGIFISGGLGSVTNLGAINGVSTDGIFMQAGGTLLNQTSASVNGGYIGVGVAGAAGTVTNQGTIRNQAAFTSQTVVFGGVILSAGGSVSNAAGGAILGTFYGAWLNGAGSSVVNAGSISGSPTSFGAGVALTKGGSVTNNSGGIISANLYGIRVASAAGTVANSGSIASAGLTAGAGVALSAGGLVSNFAGGTISAGFYGVRLLNTAGTVTNAGSIASSVAGSGGGIVLGAGGVVTNSAGGSISSGAFGVKVSVAAGTVVNAGYIGSSQTFGGAGVDLVAGGSATNAVGGLIAAKWIGVQIGQVGASIGGTFVNQGSVFAGDQLGDGAAVWVHGPGVVINEVTGVINGGPFNGVAAGDFGIVTYYGTTVINRGIIGGTTAVSASNKGVGVGNLIEVAPGASFGGIVQGARTAADAGLATLELLSGASTGTITGFGSKYQNFGHVAIDTGARWRLSGTVVAGTTIALGAGGEEALTLGSPAAMKGVITGFTHGDTITLDGMTVTGSSYAGGVLTLIGASETIALNLPGNFTTGEFAVTNAAGGGAAISVLAPRTLGWLGGGSTGFIGAANWNDFTSGLNPALSAPNDLDTAVFNQSVGGISGSGIVAAVKIGSGGAGVLQLGQGATLVAGSLEAGVGATDVGQIGLTGTATSLIVSGDAIVAADGTGVMSVLNGATFAATNLTIGSLDHSSGALVVSGSGSVINLSGALNIGTALGIGDLTVGPGAAIHAAVVNLQGQVVLEGGLLDPTVTIINQGQTAGGNGTIQAGDIVVEGVIQAGGTKPSQKLLVVDGTVVGGGSLSINGTAQPSSAVGVLQINAGGTLELTGPVLNAAMTTFQDSLPQPNTYTINNSVVDINFADATGVLRLDDIAGFGGTIVSFQAGDAFVITGGTLSNGGVSNGNTLMFSDSSPNAGAGGIDRIIFGSAINASSFAITNGSTIQAVACFAAGTRIATETGWVAVENLTAGVRVSTRRVRDTVKPHVARDHAANDDGGFELVRWVGSRVVNCRIHPNPETVWPVRVRAGAFGLGMPVRDLFLSPDHAVFVNQVLVPVRLLINGVGIARVRRSTVTYYHVELPRHAVILAEGLPVESYLDAGDRDNFHHGDTAIRLFPDFAARLRLDIALVWEARGVAPLVQVGPELVAARLTVMKRAGRVLVQSTRRLAPPASTACSSRGLILARRGENFPDRPGAGVDDERGGDEAEHMERDLINVSVA